LKGESPDALIKTLAENPTNAIFESLIANATSNCDTKWQKIAIIFEIAYKTIEHVGFEADAAGHIKRITADYIHEKYCKWIENNSGGWVSVLRLAHEWP
jgi:hypothetical protein